MPPTKRISFTNFDRRLVLAGGREQTGEAALRRASGVAPELTTSVLSRWGSVSLYGINAIQLYYFNGHRYQYDGASLYRDGSAILPGFNGTRLTFNSMPPQPGLQDYLFILGGGVTPFKIDPSGNISNWGITAPPNSAQVQNLPNDQIVIDSFESSAGNYATSNCAIANNTTVVAVGAASLSINPSGTMADLLTFTIKQSYGSLQNWSTYSNGDISLETDIFQMWLNVDNIGANEPTTWIEIDVDVHDGTFKKDWYSFAIGLLNPNATNPRQPRHLTQLVVTFQPGQWQQLTWAKSEWVRHGDNLQYDWSSVKALRFQGGPLFNTSAKYYLDNFTLSGGSGMGAGPAAGNGGSEYDYYTVYRNLTTGSQSNPNADASKVFAVSVNKTALSNIPVSFDAQVGARDLYRTAALNVAGGGLAYYLDTIYDNTTTTYTDSTSDFTIPETTTPWQKMVSVPPNNAAPYYIDAGNGYYFKLTAAGSTGATPPQWKIPTSTWAAQAVFVLGETVSMPAANGVFWQVTTAGTSGIVQPNWAGGGPITDGTVVWTSIGLQVTQDNSVQWTFQGINSTRTLDSSKPLLFDNAPPMITYGDAYGPFEGSMVFTRDSASTRGGYVYLSPPGRPESVGLAILVSGTNDPMQKVVEWDSVLWAYSTAKCYRSTGSYPAIAFPAVDDSLGTFKPYTVIAIKLLGIFYWAPDGIRVMNWGGSTVIGFKELSPIFRGQGEENILTAWNEQTGPVWAEEARNEVIFSDGVALTLGLTYDGTAAPVWRQPGRILTAGYYEHQTGEFAVSFDGNVYLFEHPGALADG